MLILSYYNPATIMYKKYLLFLGILFVLLSCRQSNKQSYTYPYQISKTAISELGMVATAHPIATEVGVQILEKGGSAVDAAIAVQLTLAVVYPRAGNIGGGGFLVHRSGEGRISSLDYRERAPIAATKDMYLDDEKNVIPGLSTKGHLASGVPGTVAGMFASHQRFGKLLFSELFDSAIDLAKNGHRITQAEADRLNRFKPDFIEVNGTDLPFVKETDWRAGDLLVQPELAQTLLLISRLGKDGFYKGITAELLLAEMDSGSGLITKEDLDTYDVEWRKPVTTDYKDYRLISMPPPSSGGIVLAQMLEMVEPYPIAEWGFDDARTIHLMAEAERRAYADRAQYLGDMDFVDVPLDSMMEPSYIKYRMADFTEDKATVSESINAGKFALAMESFETTHLSIVDREGNAASVTTTLNSNYGSKVWVKGAGFFLNNEMDDFSAKPGVPNQFGLLGAEANAIAPKKRMLSSMTPTIIEKGGDLFMVVGTPGGSTIITSVFQVFLNVAEFGMSMTEAVHAKRFHHQWLPDEIMTEAGRINAEAAVSLSNKGHTVREVSYIGKVEAILKGENGELEGAADNRGDDHAKGVSGKGKRH